MKPLLIGFLLAPFLCLAQRPPFTGNFQNELKSIVQQERQHFDGMHQSGLMQPQTVATNNFDVFFTRCEWQVDPAVNYIRGTVTFYFKMLSAGSSIGFDLSHVLLADSVRYHGNLISYQQTPNDGLTINFPATLTANQTDSVSIFYQGAPTSSGLGSFVKSTHGGVPVIWTLSEPYGASDWWPCKNGLADKSDSIEIRLTYPAAYTGTSNGVLTGQSSAGGFKTDIFKCRYPIATYLVAIAVTNYSISNDTVDINGKPMPYIGYYYPTSYADFKNYESFAKEGLTLFSSVFGDYPFVNEKYGQTQTGMGGGMEHQTNSFIGNRGPNLQIHELMHQWFGDMITCGSWQDIWLNEGFATYGVLLFLEKQYPDYYEATLGGTYFSAIAPNDGSVFVPDTTDIARIFSQTLSYNKGAYVVHMLRWVLGDSAFFRGMRRYATDPAVRFGFARTADLQRNLEEESGLQLDSFFKKWIYGEGHPDYQATWTENNNHWVKVTLTQTTTHPSVSFYEMPVELLLQNGASEKRVVVQHQYSGQSFWIDAGFAVDTVIIDPDYHILAGDRKTTKEPGSIATDQLSIYPVPAPGKLYISLKNPTGQRLSLRLFNSAGQLVMSREWQTPGQDELFEIPLERMAHGVYILKLESDKHLKWTRQVIH